MICLSANPCIIYVFTLLAKIIDKDLFRTNHFHFIVDECTIKLILQSAMLGGLLSVTLFWAVFNSPQDNGRKAICFFSLIFKYIFQYLISIRYSLYSLFNAYGTLLIWQNIN